MKTHYHEPLQIPLEAPASNRPANSRVRYEGFESIEGGRRLLFSVQPVDGERLEIAVEVPNAVFATVRGFSFQDAAPMVYEKIVGTLNHQENVNDISLTEEDIRQYVNRHTTSQKRTHSSEKGRGSDMAA